MSGDLREGLKRAAAELDAASPRPAMDARLRARLGARPVRAWRWIAVGAAVPLLALLLLRPWQHEHTIGGFAIVNPTQDLAAYADHAVVHVTNGSVTLADRREGLQLFIGTPVTLEKQAPGARIVLGTAEVAVDKRTHGAAPLRILVSHGAIEVLGTKFLVVQEDGHGRVTLHEGSIRFVALDGRVRMVKPGETLEWPLPAEAAVAATPAPAPAPEPAPVPVVTAPAPKHRVATPAPAPIHYVDADDLLRQVDTLRSRGEFAEAVRYLTHGLTRELKPSTRERFSFELGIILTDQMHDSVKACAHWKKHAAAYGEGRYGLEVERASTRAGCAK
jgi:transmembrane sensor